MPQATSFLSTPPKMTLKPKPKLTLPSLPHQAVALLTFSHTQRGEVRVALRLYDRENSGSIVTSPTNHGPLDLVRILVLALLARRTRRHDGRARELRGLLSFVTLQPSSASCVAFSPVHLCHLLLCKHRTCVHFRRTLQSQAKR